MRQINLNILFIIISLLCLIFSTQSSTSIHDVSTSIYTENDLDHPIHTIPHPNPFDSTSPFQLQQQEKEQISIHFFPTPSSTNRTLFHALILCDITRQGVTTYICTSDLFLHLSWTDTAGLTTLSHSWIQVYHPDFPILQQIQMTRTFSSVGFPLLNSNTNLLRFNQLYVFGELVWEKFDITSSLMFSIQLPSTGTYVSASTYRVTSPMMQLNDITSTFEYKKFNKDANPVISQQLWIKDIPYSYSIIYVHVAGWIGVPDEDFNDPRSKINCTLNSSNSTQVDYEYQSHLEIGFSVRAMDPITNKAITFPVGTDIVLLCSGFDLDSTIDIDEGTGIPAIGVHAQVYEYTKSYDNKNSSVPIETIPLYYQTIIHSPDKTYKIGQDPLHQEQFGFFHINDTNPYLYHFYPLRQLIWTGNNKQPLTNSKKCITQYQLRFGLNFTIDPTREFTLTSIPISIGLGSTSNLLFHSANWLLIFHHDETKHYVDGSGEFIHISENTPDDPFDKREQIQFEKAYIKPDQLGYAKWGFYEIVMSISLYCKKSGGDQASIFFAYSIDDMTTVDHRKMSYLSVFGYSNTPFRQVSGASEPNKASGIRALMNRVNLTVAEEFKQHDLVHDEGGKPTYRYTFDIWLRDIPSHVRHTKEVNIDPPEIQTPVENNMSIHPDILFQSTNEFNHNTLMSLSSPSQYAYTNQLYHQQEQQYKQNQIMLKNNNINNEQEDKQQDKQQDDDDTNIELYSPFIWVEFSFLRSFLFHGNYTQCKIWDGDDFFDIRPKFFYQNQLYDIPADSQIERLSFNFEFINSKKRQKEINRREREQLDGGKIKPEKDIHIYSSFHISCTDVYVVNFTNIVFTTEHEEHFISILISLY